MSNIAKLTRRLKRIPIGVRATVATEALLQATILQQAIQAAAPVESGALRGSVRVESGRRGDRFFVKAGGPVTTKAIRETAKGNAPPYDYANAQEFGTSEQAAAPFFYPTYRRRRTAIQRGLGTAIAGSIQGHFERSR